MLQFRNLTISRAGHTLISNISMQIFPGMNVGVTGANGCGKSTLIALILKEIEAESGDFEMPSDWVIAHVEQEITLQQYSALDYVLTGDPKLIKTQQALEAAKINNDGHKQAELLAYYEEIGGYTSQSRAAILLHGLGFNNEQLLIPVHQFSGGWQMRLNLARALMCSSDLLLLDEPTNHLDLDAVIWLENWLTQYQGTLIIISHDRDFLDNVSNHILHISHKAATLYSGNYSAFEKLRALNLAQQQAAHNKQQQHIQHIQQFITRFKAKATKAKQAQSKLKALERLELIAPAHVDSPFHFQFKTPNHINSPLIVLDDVSMGYQDTVILKSVSMTINAGDRIGLLGQNGAGKSTLIKTIVNNINSLNGTITPTKYLQPGYFSQHQLDLLKPEEHAAWHLQTINPKLSEQDIRNYLGGYNFHNDKVFDPVHHFSGGEKARLVLAMIIYQAPNLLLLDEPTNHLDIEMRLALNMALQDFQGAVILVSHDRYLLRTAVDQLLLVHDQKVDEFKGDLDDYRKWLLATNANNNTKTNKAGLNKKELRKIEAEKRQQSLPIRKKIKNLETKIQTLQNKQTEIETALADNAIYHESSKDKMQALLKSQHETRQTIAQLEDDWFNETESLEALNQELS